MTHVRIGKKIAPRFSLDVEFRVEPGITALFGASEAGKSLILNALAGFATPDSGRILQEDALLFDAAAKVCAPPHRRGCALVGQREGLFPHMNIRRNLAFAALNSPRLERTRKVGEILDLFGITQHASSRPIDLGPHERLRAEIARALLANPKMLLLDERPYDEPLLRTVRAAFSGPILIATRDLDLCCATADRLILLEHGRILQQGATSEVVNSPDSPASARLLDIPNVFECSIASLDPGRNLSRLEFEGFSLTAPYIRGHFRGDRVWVAVRPSDLRIHPEGAAVENAVSTTLIHVSTRERYARFEFDRGISVDLGYADYEKVRAFDGWQIEFPSGALRVL